MTEMSYAQAMSLACLQEGFGRGRECRPHGRRIRRTGGGTPECGRRSGSGSATVSRTRPSPSWATAESPSVQR